jgi:hypothetical protein
MPRKEDIHMRNERFWTLIAMVLGAALLRMAPHPWNFTPIGGMALFSGAMFRNRALAFAVPFATLFLSDLWIGLHSLMWAVYGSFALSVLMGMWLRRRRHLLPIAGATLAGAVLFFVITNWAVWLSGMTYPKTFAGLIACYVAAIPYFGNTLASDAFYVSVLFGGLALLEWRVPQLREAD